MKHSSKISFENSLNKTVIWKVPLEPSYNLFKISGQGCIKQGATKFTQIITKITSKKSYFKEVLGKFKDCPCVIN